MFLVSLFPLLEHGGELEDRDRGRQGGGGTDNTRDLVLHVLTLHAGLQLGEKTGLCWLEDLY